MNAADILKSKFPESVISTGMIVEKPVATIKSEDILPVCRFIKDIGFDHLSTISGVDYRDRFELSYIFWSYRDKKDLILKVSLDHDKPRIKSLTSLWKGADWLERENYDMLGIIFEDHPNLLRILLPDGWEGYPMRKDYDMKKEQYIILSEDGEEIVTTDEAKLFRPEALHG